MKTTLLILVLFTTGCAPRIRGAMNGFTDGTPAVIPAGSTLAVVPDNAAANTLFEREVRLKLQRALVRQGYRLMSPEAADYLVYASFGLGSPRQVSELEAVYHPGTTSTVKSEKGETIGTVTTSGHVALVPTTSTQQDHWLKLGVARAADVEQHSSPAPFPWVWQGETASSRTSTDLRYTIDYLIVPTVELFGKNTDHAVRFSIKKSDERVRVVRGK